MKLKLKILTRTEVEFRIFRKNRWHIILDIYFSGKISYTRIGMNRLAKSNQAIHLLSELKS
jgi:hypothetical protein